jgi:hypothetical protein
LIPAFDFALPPAVGNCSVYCVAAELPGGTIVSAAAVAAGISDATRTTTAIADFTDVIS